MSIQPSEFLKPAFVILISWLFAESSRRPEMPANRFALGLLIFVVVLLVLQPDFGQTMLIIAGLGRAVLHGRDAAGLDRRSRRLLAVGLLGRLLHGAACRGAH